MAEPDLEPRFLLSATEVGNIQPMIQAWLKI